MLPSGVGTLETDVTKPLSAEKMKGGTDVMMQDCVEDRTIRLDVASISPLPQTPSTIFMFVYEHINYGCTP